MHAVVDALAIVVRAVRGGHEVRGGRLAVLDVGAVSSGGDASQLKTRCVILVWYGGPFLHKVTAILPRPTS